MKKTTFSALMLSVFFAVQFPAFIFPTSSFATCPEQEQVKIPIGKSAVITDSRHLAKKSSTPCGKRTFVIIVEVNEFDNKERALAKWIAKKIFEHDLGWVVSDFDKKSELQKQQNLEFWQIPRPSSLKITDFDDYHLKELVKESELYSNGETYKTSVEEVKNALIQLGVKP